MKSAFLNGFSEEKVYIEQPLTYVVKGHEDKAMRLEKTLNELKQAPRVWNNRIDKCFQDNDFTNGITELTSVFKTMTLPNVHMSMFLCRRER